jgi:hypothetical protein
MPPMNDSVSVHVMRGAKRYQVGFRIIAPGFRVRKMMHLQPGLPWTHAALVAVSFQNRLT